MPLQKRKKKKAVLLFPLISVQIHKESYSVLDFGKFFFLFPALSLCSSSEVKQNVMYCILYDFSEGKHVGMEVGRETGPSDNFFSQYTYTGKNEAK